MCARTDLTKGECCDKRIYKVSAKLATAKPGGKAPTENVDSNVTQVEFATPNFAARTAMLLALSGRKAPRNNFPLLSLTRASAFPTPTTFGFGPLPLKLLS